MKISKRDKFVKFHAVSFHASAIKEKTKRGLGLGMPRATARWGREWVWVLDTRKVIDLRGERGVTHVVVTHDNDGFIHLSLHASSF